MPSLLFVYKKLRSETHPVHIISSGLYQEQYSKAFCVFIRLKTKAGTSQKPFVCFEVLFLPIFVCSCKLIFPKGNDVSD